MPDALTRERPEVPDKPSVDGLEATWVERWEDEGTYRFDADATREDVFSIDTPPPTVSGTLHIGHVFSYTHTDVVARYWRMRGKHVFYPMGWDDNGLATERRVENYFGVRGDADLAYDPFFEPPETPGKDKVPVSRKNFVELCRRLTVLDEEAFSHVFRTLGAVDRLDDGVHDDRRALPGGLPARLPRDARRAARPTPPSRPRSGTSTFARRSPRPSWWTRSAPATSHRVTFHRPDGATVQIETTRPELLASCVALVAHPDDARYADLVGTSVVDAALPRRGTGRGPRAGRPRQGHGDRDDLHLRRRHRRHLVARPVPAHPGPDRTRRALPAGDLRRGRLALPRRARGQRPLRPARGPHGQPGARRGGRRAARQRRPDRRARARSPTRSSSTRRASARWRS